MALAGLWQTTAAQTPFSENQIVITGTRFTYPLVEKWIWEFKQEHPEIAIKIVSKGTKAADSANFFINAHTLSVDEKKNRESVAIARYALLPVANSKHKGQSYSHQFGFAVLNEKDLISNSDTNHQKSIAKQE